MLGTHTDSNDYLTDSIWKIFYLHIPIQTSIKLITYGKYFIDRY